VAGIPTALSQFTNNLGNYGGFLSPASISSTPGVGPQGGGGSGAEGPVQFQLTWDGTLIGLHSPNCNCVCNC
jgi:hypothetical protein